MLRRSGMAVALCTLVACGDGAGDAGPCAQVKAGFEPELQDRPCAMANPGPGELRCGVLRVAEDPSVDSCALEIAFARYEPVDANDEPPLFVLGGGPGQPLLPYLPELVELGERVAPGRVIVAHDARGVGQSTPTLDCRQVMLDEADLQDPLAWLSRCGEVVRAQGHRAERYLTPVLADDVAALATALEVDTFDVLGASYGSRLAHVVAALHPERVGALVFDAATPLDAPLLEHQARNFDRVFGRLADDCAADAACAAAHGDLGAHLAAVLGQLAAEPASSEEPAASSWLDPSLFVSVLGAMLADADALPGAPAALAAAADGDFSAFEAYLQQEGGQGVATYMHHAIMCQEELPHNDPERVRQDVEAFPEFALPSPYDGLAAACAALGMDDLAGAELGDTPAPTQPTLALTGRYDPLSPAANWDRPSERLPNGTLLDIADAGHGARRSPCGADAIRAFLEAPEAPTWPACVDELTSATFTP